MRLHTSKVRAKSTAERWRAQYFKKGEWYSEDFMKTYAKLLLLGFNPTVEQVEKLIGMTWTKIRCGSCRKPVDEAVYVAQFEDHICRNCCEKMFNLFKFLDD